MATSTVCAASAATAEGGALFTGSEQPGSRDSGSLPGGQTVGLVRFEDPASRGADLQSADELAAAANRSAHPGSGRRSRRMVTPHGLHASRKRIETGERPAGADRLAGDRAGDGEPPLRLQSALLARDGDQLQAVPVGGKHEQCGQIDVQGVPGLIHHRL